MLGTSSVLSGMAVYTTTSLVVGSHIISATYSGDSSYLGSGSNTITQAVGLSNTTLSLTGSPNPSTVGQSVIFTATISPTAATGTITLTVDGNNPVVVGVVGGIATYSTTTLTVGTHTISATYSGDSVYASSTNSFSQSVGLNTTSLSLTSNPNPSVVGQTVIFTATVSPTAASGIVTFTEGSSVLGTASLLNGTAVYTTATLVAGSHVIGAAYSGDNNYNSSSSNTITQVVGVNSTTLSLTGSPNPSTVGQSVIFTATISPTAATGTITLTVDGNNPVVVGVVGGIATYSTTTLTVGTHTISATYSGDSVYASSTNSFSQSVGLNTTSLSLTSNPNPSMVGQSVTFTATVSPTAATGTVTFTEGSTVLGTSSVLSGMAVYTTTSLVVGSHIIRATYSGDSNYAPSNSLTITQVVATGCQALVITAITDDGAGTTCGTLSYALSQPISGTMPVTVTFALAQGNTISFTGSLTSTAKVKRGVVIYGGAFGSTTRIILNGNGVSGDGLHLAGNNYLFNLTIEHFGGRELTLEGTGNHFQGVVIIAS